MREWSQATFLQVVPFSVVVFLSTKKQLTQMVHSSQQTAFQSLVKWVHDQMSYLQE